ncbi:HDOD domain-containing protein [Candidatus Latescibacterota bacterium]
MTDSVTSWKPMRLKDVPPNILEIVHTVVDKLPDLPLSVNKIIEMASDDECDLGELVELVSSDITLVSNILKIVNSSYYGLSHKTDNLHLAIVLLGFAEVRNIALRSFVSQSIEGKDLKEYSTNQLWEHSYLVSTCAEIFSTEEDHQNRGTLMTLGLMHDVSKFALYNIAIILKKKGITPQGILNLPESSFVLEKEEKLFKVNHTIVGALLSKKWNLSERFIAVLEYHHYPSFFDISELPQEYVKEISAICISDYIVNLYSDVKNMLPVPDTVCFEVLGIEPSPEEIMTRKVIEKLDNAKKFMSIIE